DPCLGCHLRSARSAARREPESGRRAGASKECAGGFPGPYSRRAFSKRRFRERPERLRGPAGGQLEHLREVQSPASRGLPDLLAAGEPVGDDQRVGLRAANRGEQTLLADREREVAMLRLEAERSCHAAASFFRLRDLKLETRKQVVTLLATQDRLLVAVCLDDGAAGEATR